MTGDDPFIASGAEAEIFSSEFLGRRVLIKIRSPKRYRHPELDMHIRMSRMRNEVRLMRDARGVGVRTPMVYDVDVHDCSMTIEWIRGEKVRDVLKDDDTVSQIICREIGTTVADLHNAGICHGDLTTSNMILMDDGRICMIDLSMGKGKAELEDLGVDMYLLERAFTSAHPELNRSYSELLEAYRERKINPQDVFKKVDEIKGRGRYT